jgi:hypothetical protein
MPYLGNTPSTSFATVVKDSFSGDGSETAFTLSKVATTNSVSVFVENVRQEPTTAYAVSGTTLTFTAAPPNASNNIYVLHMNPTTTTTHPAAQNLTAVDGTFTGDVSVGDDLSLASDSAVLSFGADSDVTITHDPDDGLIFKSTATADDNPLLLTLQTGETDLAANDVIGKIAFQAPDEGTGTDAVLVSAAIQAVAEGDHSASSNATKLGFMTGASEAATEKMSLSSAGDLTISRTADSGTVRLNLENTGSGGSSDYSEIKFNSTAGSTVTSIVQHRNNSGMNIGTTTDHPVSILQNNTAALTVNASGDIDVETGDIFFSGSGKGINLGVTSNTDSNTLEDYEEGTWTPTMTNITLSTAQGQYIKVGKLVTAHFNVVLPTTSTTNTAVISSLPFNTAGVNQYGGGFFSYQNTSYDMLTLYNQGETYCTILNGANAVNNSNISGKQFLGTIVYYSA